jgi:cytochrome oxidase Cu insertion factor (SCO1/SenC/PrrC family)
VSRNGSTRAHVSHDRGRVRNGATNETRARETARAFATDRDVHADSLRRMLEQGTAAPDFELADQDGETVKLSYLKGQTVVLYFYPKADARG